MALNTRRPKPTGPITARWRQKGWPTFLSRLIERGGHESERQMALALGETQETIYAFRRAIHRPARLEIFLLKYSEKHGFDRYALIERWEFVPELRLSTIERRLGSIVSELRAQGDPTLSRLATEVVEANHKKIKDLLGSTEKELHRLSRAIRSGPSPALRASEDDHPTAQQ